MLTKEELILQKPNDKIKWRKIKADGLDVDYAEVIPNKLAGDILQELEDTLEYFTGDLAKVKVYGKIYPIPRQQVAYGDEGIRYKYSGVTVPALPWPRTVQVLRDYLEYLIGIKYDFVLVNKYRSGSDHIGEHRDDEPEIDPNFPIASVTFGQKRTFTFRHKDARKSGKEKLPIPPVKLELEHGSILLMNPPTNKFWYHSLPLRKSLLGVRINLTFRKHRAGAELCQVKT